MSTILKRLAMPLLVSAGVAAFSLTAAAAPRPAVQIAEGDAAGFVQLAGSRRGHGGYRRGFGNRGYRSYGRSYRRSYGRGFRGGYGQSRYRGGYGQSRYRGGYGRSRHRGSYGRSHYRSGYGRSRHRGAYGRRHSSGRYGGYGHSGGLYVLGRLLHGYGSYGYRRYQRSSGYHRGYGSSYRGY